MADIKNTSEDDAPIVISEDDARGADDDVPAGDTLVPMLLWGLALATVGIAAFFFFVR